MQSLRSADSTGRQPALAPTVALVADDDLVARRIDACLSTDAIRILDRASELSGLSDAAEAAGAVVLASRAPESGRRSLIKAVTTRFPGVPTVMVASLSANGVHKILETGASGLVLDSHVESALPATVRAVCAGQVVVPDRFRHQAARPALSHREKQALALVAAGMTNRQIADRLFLAESTVKTHLSSVFGKLGVCSRSEASALVHDPDEKLGLSLLGLSPAQPAASQNGEAGA